VIEAWGLLTADDRRRIRAIVDGRLALWPQVGAAAPLTEVISIPAAGEGEAVPSMTGASADQAERLGSLMGAKAIATEVADLAAVWHRLPAAVRAGIVAMVRASGG